MPTARKTAATAADRIRGELQLIRANVTGVYGSLAATSDGLPLAHDLSDLEATEISALVATTHALASRTTLATGRGQFREAVARGSDGYLAVYAAGHSAIVAVIGTSRLNVGMLQYQVREIIERIAVHAADLGKWPTAPAAGQARSRPDAGRADADRNGPRPLPARRPSTR
jgi:uncharacterized protein